MTLIFFPVPGPLQRSAQVKRLALILGCLLLTLGSQTAFAQTPSTSTAKPDTPAQSAITSTYAFGEVVTINPTARQILIKTKEGNVTASFDNETQFKSVRPGSKTLDNAEPITLADVGIGDTLLARGRFSPDKTTVLARQIIVMTKKAIAQKQEHDRDEWRTRSLAGRVTAINPQTREVTLEVRTAAGDRLVPIDLPDKVVFRRYQPDSIRFSDALASSFEELKVGDQLRALGQKSNDGTRFAAEAVVAGSFRILGGAIISVNPATNEITINDIPTKKPVTVVINANSKLRQVPAEVVASLAPKNAPGGNQSTPGASGTKPAEGATDSRSSASGTDLLEMFDRLPPVTISDLKPGRMVLISSTTGVDSSRATAILLATGLDSLFRPAPAQTKGRAPVGAVGLPNGIFDGYIGGP